MGRDTDTTDEANRKTRRSVLRRTLASAGVALGLATRGGATDRRGNGTTQNSEYRARIYASDLRPGALFRVVSGPIDYKPEVPVQEGEAFLEGLYWNDYGTRIIRYQNTGERVLFFPALDAPIDRGAPYRMGNVRSTDQLAEGIVGVGFGPVASRDGTGR